MIENGGFGKAPKFPQPLVYEFLLRYYSRRRDYTALRMVRFTLEKMARGGIYDQVGGGFHRYATDSQWRVPHFEKMLYDNALLSRLYLHAYMVTGRTSLRFIAEETCNYVLREMANSEGGFYSTQDADTEGSEGNYYLWTPGEIAEAVGEGLATIVNRYLGVSEKGNFEGKNILHIAAAPAPEMDIVIQAKEALLKKREQRVRPARDEKILSGWNGLMLASLAEAACILDRKDYLAAAVANGSFLLEGMVVGGRLRHSFKDGQARIEGYLLDYAQVIEGLLMLHQATLRGRWLQEALRLAQVMVEEFWDEPDASFYDTGKSHENLFIRPRDVFDGALPSGASSAALALLKLGRLADNKLFEQIAARALRPIQAMQSQNPLAFGHWLCALDFYLSPPQEIAIIGAKDDPTTSEFLRALSAVWLPNKVVGGCDPADPTPITALPLLTGRRMIDDQPTVYICQRYACQEPITSPASLGARLRELVPPEPMALDPMPEEGGFGF